MNGPQTYSEMIDQPLATSADFATAFFPIVVPGVNGAKPTTKLVVPGLISTLVATGTIAGQETTFNAVPISIPNLPTIPPAGGAVSMQGQITAYDTTTGDTATWDIALVVKRVPNATTCQTVGDTTPALFPPAEGALAPIAENSPPTLSANSAGPVITLTGVSSGATIFGYTFTYLSASVAS